jgi:hemin uptake protein HemP
MMMQTVEPPASATPTYDARILTAGQAMAQIVLDEYVYTLRITKAGKLILTK